MNAKDWLTVVAGLQPDIVGLKPDLTDFFGGEPKDMLSRANRNILGARAAAHPIDRASARLKSR